MVVDIDELVIDQGETLDKVDNNIEETFDNTKQTNRLLVDARHSHSSQRKKKAMLCCVFLMIMATTITIIVISVKK